MFFTSIRRRMAGLKSLHLKSRASAPRRVLLGVECLEDRTVPATFTVNSALDNGAAGTFRWAIGQANANAGSTINFDIAPAGQVTITVNAALGALPAITASTTINGYTQGPNFGVPYVEINGANLTADGLTVNAGGVDIFGLAVDGFNGNGIVLNNPLGTGDLIQGCYAGVDLDGKTAHADAQDGVLIKGSDNTIGSAEQGLAPCIFSGNGAYGVHVTGSGAQRNTIVNDYLGVDITGVTALANANSGIFLDAGSGNNTVGGVVANVISGNRQSGIYLDSSNSNQILDNDIGLGNDGTTVVANGQDGISLFTGSSNNTIGGNVISGNGRNGVLLSGPNISGNQIVANKIGTDVTGVIAKGNTTNGVNINSTTSNTIGGADASQRNVISANGGNGIYLGSSNNNLVAGNYIGLDATGMNTKDATGARFGNGQDGILITGNNNTIGVAYTGTDTTKPHFSNLISANSGSGIEISGGSINQVINNSIGTDSTGFGAATFGNAAYGVRLDRNLSTLTGATNNTIGGVQGVQTRNIIGNSGQNQDIGNNGYGVYIQGSGTTGNVIEGDYIGIAFDGKTAIGNANDGVYIEVNANGNTIGGTTSDAGNVISCNGTQYQAGSSAVDGYGVEVYSNNNLIEYNYIGLDGSGGAGGIYVNKEGWMNDQGTGNVWLNNKHQ